MDSRDPARQNSRERALCVALVSDGQVGKEAAALLAEADPEAEVLPFASPAACSQLEVGRADVVLLDEGERPIPAGSMKELVHSALGLPVVLLSRSYDAARTQKALQAGASDVFALDTPDARRLRETLRHAVWRSSGSAAVGSDTLTGLVDRGAFASQFESGLLRSERARRQMAVLLVDLDGLAAINDGMGHDVGDRVIATAATRLSGSTRRSDLVARVSGSNFAVLLHDVAGEHTAARVADLVLRQLSEPVTIDGKDFWVGSNVGIAMFPRDGREVTQLLGHAEAALHQARARGRGEYRFHSESMNARARKRLTLENNLRRAIAQNGLRLHYQPQVDTRTGRLLGAEALVRWTDPELGEVSPVDFIPVAEQTGLIIPLGEWVLRAATDQLGRWKRQGLRDIRMSINVSARQLEGADFREKVARALWDSDIESRDVVLEVTESVLVENEETAIETLGEFAQRGVGISLDDFGTGFSALSFLKRFPLESVKIDRSFMEELVFDPDDRAIVTAILSIAKQLRLSVIAEGVETEPQRAFLEQHGCDEIQGFLVSPAVPPEHFFARFGRAAGRKKAGAG